MSEEVKLLELGSGKDGPMLLQAVGINDYHWQNYAFPLIALKGYEFVIRVDQRGVACLYRRAQ